MFCVQNHFLHDSENWLKQGKQQMLVLQKTLPQRGSLARLCTLHEISICYRSPVKLPVLACIEVYLVYSIASGSCRGLGLLVPAFSHMLDMSLIRLVFGLYGVAAWRKQWARVPTSKKLMRLMTSCVAGKSGACSRIP